MAYSDFTFQQVIVGFQLIYRGTPDLFPNAADIAPTALLVGSLERGQALAGLVSTEKAWSELVIAPILMEVRSIALPQEVTFFSGTEFNVDPADKLTGYCDYILGQGPQHPFVTAPLFMIVEAKKDDIAGGLGQCAAAMVAAQRFNQRDKRPLGAVYGAVTNGAEWRFLKLNATAIELEEKLRPTADLPKLLGIFLNILGITPAAKGA